MLGAEKNIFVKVDLILDHSGTGNCCDVDDVTSLVGRLMYCKCVKR